MDFLLQSVAGLVFAAASVDPDWETVYWYQHAGDAALVSWLLPTAIRTTNREILTLKPELEQMLPEWSRLKEIPTTIVHGDQDTLVPIGNADFIQQQLPARSYAPPHRGKPFPSMAADATVSAGAD